MAKIYKAVRKGVNVEVYVDDKLLDITPSQKVHHHSEGFEFGYLGSGPSQLALAILLDVTNSSGVALKYYQLFKMDFIAPADYTLGVTILESQIHSWLQQRVTND